MKKVLLCCTAALFMFSCSNEEEIQKPDTSKEVQTDDPAIGYKSPFDFPTVNLIDFPYVFKNDTDLDFELVAYVGLAFHDGIDDLTHFGIGIAGGSPNSYDLINLTVGGLEYGNSIPTIPMMFPAFSTSEIYEGGHLCPTRYGSGSTPVGLFFDIEGSGATSNEAAFLGKMGKVYYFKYDALDANGGSVASGLVKVFFPPNAALGANWSYGGIDVLTGDKLMYENTTREICIITDTVSSSYYPYDEFVYAGRVYKIVTEIDETGIYVRMVY
jgi:hypothetical protein